MQRVALEDGTYTVLVVERRRAGRSDDTTVRARSGLVQRHGGVEVGETASGTAVASGAPGEAIRCAVAVQEAQETVSELALGVHAGEVRGADGAEAAAVQQAARLARLAGPGGSSHPRWCGS